MSGVRPRVATQMDVNRGKLLLADTALASGVVPLRTRIVQIPNTTKQSDSLYKLRQKRARVARPATDSRNEKKAYVVSSV